MAAQMVTTTSTVVNAQMPAPGAQNFAFCTQDGSNICIQIYRLDGDSLGATGAVELTISEAQKGYSMQSISYPDYLVALAGSSLCVACLNSSKEFILHHFTLVNNGETIKEASSLKVGKSATAIFVRNSMCFLGFPGSVGVVDLTNDTLSLHEFHNWGGQTWGGNNPLKTIDCFTFDSNHPKELCAVDDVVWPKFAYWYDIESKEPKLLSTANLPTSLNDHYHLGLRLDAELILTSVSHHSGGTGRFLRICDHKGANIESFQEFIPRLQAPKLFSGDKDTEWTGVGAVGNLVVLGLGTRGLIAIDRKKTTKKKEKSYEVSVPFVSDVNKGNCVFASSAFNHKHVFALFSSSETTDFVIFGTSGSTLAAIQKHVVKGKPTFVAFDANQ